VILEIQVLAWDRGKNVAGLSHIVGFQLFPLIIGTSMAIHM